MYSILPGGTRLDCIRSFSWLESPRWQVVMFCPAIEACELFAAQSSGGLTPYFVGVMALKFSKQQPTQHRAHLRHTEGWG